MKKINKIIVWAMLSIMMQCAGLLYLDKVFFKESSEFTVEKVEITTKNTEANVSIPTNAEKVEVSFDGRFITYYLDDKFMLVNIKTSEITEILADKEILFTGWVPNNNVIIIAEELYGKVNINTYNVKNEVENPIGDVASYKNGTEVSDIVVSAKTGSKYVCISSGGDSSTIYRIGIENDDMKALYNRVTTLGSITALPLKDVLIYEDSYYNNFYRYANGSREKIDFANANNLVILGAGSDNMIYMGELSGDKVVKIIYGVDETDSSTWKTETLEEAKDIKDITINSKNEILINDNLKGIVKNITTGNTITYEGTFMTVNDKVVCYSDNGKIYLKSVTDVDKKVTTKK
ncbi:dipeptidyl-peptidase IV [Clostridium vincentii]|uniref:Beta propeller domain protein n=1 Tax=Clostridium vincentii TaxID=52704 RepID=A0A2T0BBP1_9CLOT|nr:dipeptidyl-peptidase IV [Clostridium vincentii]PRR81304.1 hypothetical protein CLVI_26230 [Clostridium vincentii]